MIFILVEDLLPDLKKQIEDNVVGWHQSFDGIQVTIPFFEELKTTVIN